MKFVNEASVSRAIPLATAFVAAAGFGVWLVWGVWQPMSLRLPEEDGSSGPGGGQSYTNAVLLGELIRGPGQPSALPGTWPRFRGANFDGIARDSVPLKERWDASGPRRLWSVAVGEGYAGAVAQDGRVYVMDYDQEKRRDALRCLSLADGKEIWRFTYPMAVKRNHGMSRTVPTLSGHYVLAMGPKCHVVCLDAVSGELRWGLDLVTEFGATVPPWYAGQCVLVDEGKVILAIGGKEALFGAFELATGKLIWKTANPKKWLMTHSSVVPMEFAGRKMYVYCASQGVAGIAAVDGAVLWETSVWKISIATIPSPLVLEDGKIFLSGGYDAGSLMLQLKENAGHIAAEVLFRLKPDTFGSTQHTPIYYEQHIYGVRPDGQLVCLSPDGTVKWASGPGHEFGLGPYLIADGKIVVLNDSGKISLIDATPDGFRLLGEAQVLSGRESWGPLALAGGRLIARDLTSMICLDLREDAQP